MFVYDIVGVFGSQVISEVAQKAPNELPIKIMLPRAGGFAIIGLGDIVIPGILASLLCRIQHIKSHMLSKKSALARPCPPNLEISEHLYLSSLVAYTLGLLVCLGVLLGTGRAQPALIYILPLQTATLIRLQQSWAASLKLDELELLHKQA